MKHRHEYKTVLLLCLSLGLPNLAFAAVCDVDSDGDIDRRDLRLIVSARDTPADGPGDLRDADGDGRITMTDARSCVRRCNLAKCVIIDATPQNAAKEAAKSKVSTSGQSSTGSQQKKFTGGTNWEVKSGDTLYAIGRAVFPGDARKQAQLRRDIVELNPSVFANGASNMSVGIVLNLPGYAAPGSSPSAAVEPAPVPAAVAVKKELAPAAQPAAVPKVEPEPQKPQQVAAAPEEQVEPEPAKQVEQEPAAARAESDADSFPTDGSIVVGLGFSYGGDELVDVEGPDVSAGGGYHLRLGYDNVPRQGSGYRLALGLQYVLFGSSLKGTYQDTYLQLSYLYRMNSMIYGIGLSSHAGAKLEGDKLDISTDYDASNGIVLHLENVGNGSLGGWGLSYTSLDIEEEGSSTSIDASRLEVYYNWRF